MDDVQASREAAYRRMLAIREELVGLLKVTSEPQAQADALLLAGWRPPSEEPHKRRHVPARLA